MDRTHLSLEEGFTGERKKEKRKQRARQSNKRVYPSIFEIYARSWTFRGTCTRPTLNLSEKGSRVEICSWAENLRAFLLETTERKKSGCSRGSLVNIGSRPPDAAAGTRIPGALLLITSLPTAPRAFRPFSLPSMPDLRTVAAESNASLPFLLPSCPLSTDDKEQGEEFICHGSKMCTQFELLRPCLLIGKIK